VFPRDALHRVQLLVRDPLQPRVIIDARRVLRQKGLHAGPVGLAKFLGPRRPAPVLVTPRTHVRVDRVMQRVQVQGLATLSLVGGEPLRAGRPLRDVLAHKVSVQFLEDRELGACDARVIDVRSCTQPIELGLKRRRGDNGLHLGAFAEPRHAVDGDVQHVQEMP
jgi:hypothetical protein